VAEILATVKTRLRRMRACNETAANGKLCLGHLKSWYGFGPEWEAQYGRAAELYRCERCQTVYLPNPEEKPRTGTLAF
jgi:hypothetical protein